MALRILVVCTANICRSPATAELLRRKVADPALVDVSSAGVAALEGAAACVVSTNLVRGLHAATDRPRAGAPAQGARLVTAQLLLDADLVLALDRWHRAALAQLAPATRSRTFTLRQAARLAAQLRQQLEAGQLPLGAPPVPSDPQSRLAWLVTELDAARSSSPSGAAGADWHPDDVPDPHVVGFSVHPQALELIAQSVQEVAAAMRPVLAISPSGAQPNPGFGHEDPGFGHV